MAGRHKDTSAFSKLVVKLCNCHKGLTKEPPIDAMPGAFVYDFQSVEFSERAEILLFARENIALKLNG